jgi:hypothetical protein
VEKYAFWGARPCTKQVSSEKALGQVAAVKRKKTGPVEEREGEYLHLALPHDQDGDHR